MKEAAAAKLAPRKRLAGFMAALGLLPASAVAGEQLEIVGSSTVYPFTTVAAERFRQVTGSPTPKVESTGTGGGLKLLCAGVGLVHPDLANASRPVKSSEVELCAGNGIENLIEIKIGYDGIVLARSNAGESMSLTLTEVFLALARDLPDSSGQLSPNPNQKWSDINPSLPDLPILVYGPPPTSGTRDAFVELGMEHGCESAPGMDIVKEDKDTFKAVCASIREDGAFVEAGENDNLIIQRLVSNPDTFGIFGYSFLEENADKVRGVTLHGVEPEYETIEDGSYPLARPLFVYAKAEHMEIKPDLKAFIEFYLSDDVLGEDGFLAERGLVPLPEEELAELRAAIELKH